MEKNFTVLAVNSFIRPAKPLYDKHNELSRSDFTIAL